MPDDNPERESVPLEHAADGLRLMRLFHSLTSQEDRENLFLVVEAFVKNVKNREPK